MCFAGTYLHVQRTHTQKGASVSRVSITWFVIFRRLFFFSLPFFTLFFCLSLCWCWHCHRRLIVVDIGRRTSRSIQLPVIWIGAISCALSTETKQTEIVENDLYVCAQRSLSPAMLCYTRRTYGIGSENDERTSNEFTTRFFASFVPLPLHTNIFISRNSFGRREFDALLLFFFIVIVLRSTHIAHCTLTPRPSPLLPHSHHPMPVLFSPLNAFIFLSNSWDRYRYDCFEKKDLSFDVHNRERKNEKQIHSDWHWLYHLPLFSILSFFLLFLSFLIAASLYSHFSFIFISFEYTFYYDKL